MAVTDSSTQLAVAYAPTSTGTAAAPNYIDLQAPGTPTAQAGDWGMGNDWIWWTQVNVTFTSGGSATLQLQLQGNPTDTTFSSGNLVVIGPTTAVPVATLVKGYEGAAYGGWKYKYPRGSVVRYVRLQSIIATAAMTAGSINSWLTNDDMQDIQSSAAGYTVL